IFCVCLRWQLWHTRIHLAWFLLLTPVAVLIVNQQLPKPAPTIACMALLLFAAMTVCENACRPVLSARFWSLPREKQYFTPLKPEEEGLRQDFINLVDRISES